MSPLKHLVLEVFMAGSLCAFALNECADQKYKRGAIDGFLAAASAASAVNNYKRVRASLDNRNTMLTPS